MGGLPGVKVGPLDPEATADFGQVAANRSARRLIRLHAASMPPVLQQALAKPLNEARTKALRLSEVRDAVEVPDGHVVVGATVRGKEGDELVLTYTYRHVDEDKARTVKWFVPLTEVADDLEASMELGDRLAVVAERRELGLLSTGGEQDVVGGDAHQRSLERQLDDLKRENDKLSKALQERDAARVDDDVPGGEAPTSDEPWEGYDDAKADDIARSLSEADQDTRDRVADYEAANKNRATVMRAAERTDQSGD